MRQHCTVGQQQNIFNEGELGAVPTYFLKLGHLVEVISVKKMLNWQVTKNFRFRQTVSFL